MRVSAVDQNIASIKLRSQFSQNAINQRRRNHQPHRPRATQLRNEIVQRSRTRRAFARECRDRLHIAIVNNALVSAAQESSHHVGAHAAESNHSDLHSRTPSTLWSLWLVLYQIEERQPQ